MNTTRKIIFSFLFIFTLSVISIDSTLAQTSQGTTVATVNISNAKIVSSEDRDYKISFDISNRVGAQPQIKYSVRLTEMTGKTEVTIDEKVYGETISLGENTKISKVVDYTIPPSVPIGTYRLWIDSKNENGLLLGVALVSDVRITKNTSNTVWIIPNSCHLMRGGSVEEFPISQGIYIEPTQDLTLGCEIQSNLSINTIFTPNFITRSHGVFGDVVEATGITIGSFTLKNGINDIHFAIPKAQYSQDYNLSLSLISEDKKTISNTISFNYIIAGQNGTIKNVVFDKTYYRAGDIANLQIFSTQTSTGTVAAIIMGETGACSVTLNKDIAKFSIINLEIPIINDCNNPKANITLSANGDVLDSKNFEVMTVSNTSPFIFPKNTLLIAIVTIFAAVLLIAVFIYKRKNLFILSFFISIIFGSSIYLLNVQKAEAHLGGCWGSCASGITGHWDTTDNCLHCPGGAPPPPPPPPPSGPTIGSFNVSSNPTSYNSSVDISWSSSNTTYCTLVESGGGGVNNGTFTVGTSGSRSSGNLTSNTTLSLNCTGSGGTTPNNTIVVTVNPPINVEINAATTTVSIGGATNISWSSTGVDYCDITKNGTPWMTSSSNYQYLSQFGSSGSGAGQFDGPFGVGVDSQGYIYVTDTNNNRIQKFNSSGQFVWWFGYNGTATGTHTTGTGIAGSLEGQFNAPAGLDIDSSDNIYVADSGNNRIQKFDKNGNLKYVKVGWPTYSFGSYGTTGQGEFNVPSGIAVGSFYIYVADTYNNRIQAISGINGYDNYIFGNQSNTPFGIALDSSEKIYVADSGNNRIQKLDSYTSNIPSLQFGGFNFPKGIILDSQGNIYFADTNNNQIYKHDSSGNYQAWLYSYSSNGGQRPIGITLDSSNYMYVVDSGNNRIQKFSPPNNNLSGSQPSGSLTSNTTFTATCVKDDGVTYQSVTKSVTVDINEEEIPAPTNVVATSNTCGQIDLSWTSPEPGNTFKVYRDDVAINLNVLSSPYTDILLPGDTSSHSYYVIASNPTLGDSASSTADSASATACPPPSSVSGANCTLTQAEPFDGNFYVNRSTTLRVMLDTTNLTGISTKWSGTNFSSPVSVSGLTYNKIYTTIGSKTINAEVTGLLSGEPFSTSCSTSTIVKLDPGTGGEI